MYLIYYVHSNIHARMVTPELRYTQIYKHLSYHLLVVTDAKNPAKYNKSHVKETLSSMKTSQASSEGVFQQRTG